MADRSDIDEVRTRTDLVSVVERYVTLKRAGRQLKGLCPFHQEKTPSFVVSPEIGYWKCFGQCGEGGDVFKFIQKIENLTFPEALERLALQAGVTLTSRQPRAAGGADAAVPSEAGSKDRLRQINALALRFYRDVLERSPVARDYLQERGLAHEAQENFQLGFAAEDWDGLCRFLTRSGVSLADAEKAGLVTIGERGAFDKLRGRLVFPILDVHERPIAFGGRLIGEARPNQPKYWNSPETPLFSKGREMYGLWRARKAIAAREQAVVVEGYTDVIACHQAGFENVVATLGTSLTEEHVQTLARLASVVLLAFDADSAGLKAAFRAASIFEAQQVDVRVLALPSGEDPDSLLRKGKRIVFERAMEDAAPLVEYRLKRLTREHPSKMSDRDKAEVFDNAIPILATITDPAKLAHYTKIMMPYHPLDGVVGVSVTNQIQQDVARYIDQKQGEVFRQEVVSRKIAPRTDTRFKPDSTKTLGSAVQQAERHLLRALVSNDPALAGLALSEITAAEFVSERARALGAYLYDHYAQTGTLDPREVLAALGDDPRADVLAGLLMNSSEEPLTSEALAGEIAHLKDRAKEQALSGLKARILDGTADAETLRRFAQLQSELRGTPKSPLPPEGN